MIIDEIKKDLRALKVDAKSLRKFGLTLGIVFLLIAGYQLWRRHGVWVYFADAAGFFLIFGIFYPAFLRPVQTVWMILAFLMGWVMTRVILFILFFFVVTPIGVIARLCGKRFLDERWKEGDGSDWIDRTDAAVDKTSYEKQF